MIFLGKRVIDITLAIRQGMPVYPADPEPIVEQVNSIRKDGFALSTIYMGSHTGTHVDAPSHVLEGGISVDKLLPEGFIGRAILVDLSCVDSIICASHLDMAWNSVNPGKGIEILLLKTGAISSSGRETKKFCMHEDTACWISSKNIKAVGVDAFSVEDTMNLPLHRLLLFRGINIVECLDLGCAEEGCYTFICLPLKITGCDGAPARAILIEE